MFCPNCGARLSDDARFCPNCGAPIDAGVARPNAGAAAPGGAGYPPASTSQQQPASAPGGAPTGGPAAYAAGNGAGAPKKRSKAPFIIAGVAVVALIALGVAFFLTSGFGLLGPKPFQGTVELASPFSSISFSATVDEDSIAIEMEDGSGTGMMWSGSYGEADAESIPGHVLYRVDNLNVVPYNNFTVLEEMVVQAPLGFEEGNLAGDWMICLRGTEGGDESIISVVMAHAEENGSATIDTINQSAYSSSSLDVYDPTADAFNESTLDTAFSTIATGTWSKVGDGRFQLDVDMYDSTVSFTITVDSN